MPPPDRDRATVATAFARFVADIIDEPTPTVRWFAPSADAPLAFVHHDHADTVFLRDNLTADEMLIAIPHELAHLHQFRRWPELTEAEAEAAAERFAEQILAEAPTAEAPTAEAPTAEAATRHRQFLPTASTTSERAWTGTRAWPRWSPDG